MVQFSRNKEAYLSNIMGRLNNFREENSLCDVCIVVGCHKLHAHKNVLAASSDYFNSYFLGPLAEESATEVNISFLTTESMEVEPVINFLYTGEIDIDFNNLESIVKISSFLLIKELRDFCSEFMLSKCNTDNLDNFPRLYLIAVDYMIPEVENKLGLSVKSRFHDYIITRDKTDITPEQLSFLVRKLDIFEYCDVIDICNFLTGWIIRGGTDEHDTLACEILETDSVIKQLDRWCRSCALSKKEKSEVPAGLVKDNIAHTDRFVESQEEDVDNTEGTMKINSKKLSQSKELSDMREKMHVVSNCVTNALSPTLSTLPTASRENECVLNVLSDITDKEHIENDNKHVINDSNVGGQNVVTRQSDKTADMMTAIVQSVEEDQDFDTHFEKRASEKLCEKLLNYMPELAGPGQKSNVVNSQDLAGFIDPDPEIITETSPYKSDPKFPPNI